MAHFTADVLTKPTRFNFAEDVVDFWAAKSPTQQAMHWVSQNRDVQLKLTYSHFSRESHRGAAMLRRLGAKKGDRMLILLPRIPAWWEIVCAAIRCGVVVCPCTTLLVDKDIEYRIHVSKASLFVCDESNAAKLSRVRSKCPTISTVIQVGGVPSEKVISYEEQMSPISQDEVFPSAKLNIGDASMVYFTSGTTGLPKMVLHNQISYPLAHTITGKHWLRLSPGKVYWNLSEQGWAKAAWSFFGAWNCGASLFVHDDRGAFSAPKLMEMLHQFPVTTLCAPPTVYRQLVTKENRRRFSTTTPLALEHCLGAGEPLNGEVIKVWSEMTKGIQIRDGYGQTETIMVCGNFQGSPVKPGSMGRPSPGVILRIIDDKGVETPEGVEGDIAILCQDGSADGFFGIFDGYLDAEGQLRRPVRIAADRRSWYLTGDRAERDKDGYFWFVGRSDDIINSAGYRIGPFEVESALKLHPGVVESAVVASPDPERVEVVKAFIVLSPDYVDRDHVALTKEIQDFCKENAAPYKYPRRIEFVSPEFLPKTISGKIKRAELKKMEFSKVKARSHL